MRADFFCVDFNDRFFSVGFSKKLADHFANIYFDCSTFKFVALDQNVTAEGLHRLLKKGGKVYIPQPEGFLLTLTDEEARRKTDMQIRDPENWREEFDRTIRAPKQTAHDEKVRAYFEREGFSVEIIKASHLKGDPILDIIKKNVISKHTHSTAPLHDFDLLVATKQ